MRCPRRRGAAGFLARDHERSVDLLMHRMRTLDANLYMPGAVLAKVDRMAMQHALEVRSPLLDPQFAEIAMSLSEDDCW